MNKLHSKGVLRRQQRHLRRNLATQQRSALDHAICRHLLNLIASREPQLVAAYSPFDGEADITPVFRHLTDYGITLALPVISAGPIKSMAFKAWQPESKMQRNSYGILEPQEGGVVSPPDIDILIVPLLAYDRCGNRLGMGAGYYDRYLEPLRDSSRPLRLGAAYSIQEIEQINSDDWDIPLHGIVNEHGWLAFVD